MDNREHHYKQKKKKKSLKKRKGLERKEQHSLNRKKSVREGTADQDHVRSAQKAVLKFSLIKGLHCMGGKAFTFPLEELSLFLQLLV